MTELSARFASERAERQQRRALERADFDALTDAGFHLTGVPPDMGGINGGVQDFTRPLCEMLRILAKGDPSVSLVASMHPAVIGGWLEVEEAPSPFAKAWEEQRRTVFETARDGCWWGTIISEPGSGGDPSRSRAVAKPHPSDGKYLISGQKHFGSGSGITSFMITQAVPEGESAPDVFYMDMRGVPWDGSAGATLTRAWDGHGMTATQSHAMDFDGMPATRAAWPDNRERQRAREIAGRPAGHLFTSVIVGVVESAVEAARQQIQSKKDSMRPFEQVEVVAGGDGGLADSAGIRGRASRCGVWEWRGNPQRPAVQGGGSGIVGLGVAADRQGGRRRSVLSQFAITASGYRT